jgi:hypothetical protein
VVLTAGNMVQLLLKIFVILYAKHYPKAEPTICQNNKTFNKYINLGKIAFVRFAVF